MKFNIHAGHGPAGGQGCGAIGLLNESEEARKVKDKVIYYLRKEGHEVYDCSYNEYAHPNKILSEIVKKCNNNVVDLDISIHLNSGRNDFSGDGSTGGTEVYGYNEDVQQIATSICHKVSNTLKIQNRGFKISKELYVLNSTKSKAILIECCFVDDKDDFNKWDADKCAKAISEALVGHTISDPSPKPNSKSGIDAFYMVYDGKWSDFTINTNGSSGKDNVPIKAYAVKSSKGVIRYRAHLLGKHWGPFRTGCNPSRDYAGDGRTIIDGIQMEINGVPGYNIEYRVSLIGSKAWGPWIVNYSSKPGGYAGEFGKAIDKIQIRIKKK